MARGPVALAKTLVAAVNDRFLRACRREPVDATPVWFMRQAGRYMADYRALRAALLPARDLPPSPSWPSRSRCSRWTSIEVDAAILFSDLLLPFTPMGLDFDFVKGEGPSIEQPDPDRVGRRRLRRFEPREALAHVLETIRLLRARAGGPGAADRLRRRAVHAGGVRDRRRAVDQLRRRPRRSCTRSRPRGTGSATGSRDMIADYLRAQVEAGAQAMQIFDSWAGALGRADYREFALPHTQRDLRSRCGAPACR